MSAKRVSAIAVALVAAFLFAACGGGSSDSSASGSSSGAKAGGTISIQGQDANDHGTKAATSGSSVEVEMDDYYFEPTVITGTAGETITLDLKNNGSTTHNFSLPSQKISEDLSPGDTKSVTVTFPSSGTALFVCKFHASMGMRGGLL
ncbi:MAG: hypothetical protein QOC87_666, partial [Actinomycetota bacterium]|nr:hypothetical protein [Actinomycetota bacterium]